MTVEGSVALRLLRAAGASGALAAAVGAGWLWGRLGGHRPIAPSPLGRAVGIGRLTFDVLFDGEAAPHGCMVRTGQTFNGWVASAEEEAIALSSAGREVGVTLIEADRWELSMPRLADGSINPRFVRADAHYALYGGPEPGYGRLVPGPHAATA